MEERERARHWSYAELPDVDLLSARYIQHAFPQHTHDGYVIGAITGGVEEVRLPSGVERIGPGGVVMINPDVAHTARAGVPEGWAYHVLYPAADMVADIAAEISAVRGAAWFRETVTEDAEAAQLIMAVHRAAERGNALAADTVLREAIARLLRRHGGAFPPRTEHATGARTAARARDILEARMSAPPTLTSLATELGTSSFALLRAFRATYGMPPHAWLTDARVRRARRLLEAGTAPAEAATLVGFTDQPHLNRHFARIVGVPPGAYRRERSRARERTRAGTQGEPQRGEPQERTRQSP
ncbi:AraC family transcriptional regulator [Streptomyces zagrosensis]|uniref:AraC-like DNA-binding protein n=1 Tax=Streptomyces zagrosensis TaxID=1042984 RepID=A0A7W9UZW9_9ACTN|nr:AraC family transcriptional regulator [Streptomyces zagrosensis]MBB5937500.1 AraC-like DNA-binding protein [Streptomyces zagrosensis]